MLADGVKAGTFDAGAQNSPVNVSVPVSGGAYHTIELLMPYSQDLRFTGLTVNVEAAFAPPPPGRPAAGLPMGTPSPKGSGPAIPTRITRPWWTNGFYRLDVRVP